MGRWRAARLVLLTGSCVVAGLPGAPGYATVPPAAAAAVEPRVPSVTVTVSPDEAATAGFVTVTATYRNVVGDGRYVVAFGDGTEWGLASFGEGPCELPPATEASVTHRMRHAYRRPGVYAVTARFEADCYLGGGLGPVYAGTATVRVLPGDSPSNGPEPPFADALPYRPAGASARTVALSAVLGDADGFVSEVVADWGDGRREVRRRPLAECADPLLHWPESWDEHQLRHTYARPGRYRVTVRVTSTGCDGRDVQVRRRTVPVAVR